MKKWVGSIFLWFVSFFPYAVNNIRVPYLVEQKIEFHNPDASEVFLVWGVNNWSQQEKILWPAGTKPKGGLLYTPLSLENGVFSTKLFVRPNTMIDYVFWISKGPRGVACDIWDANQAPQKDYHTLATNNNTVIIDSKQKVVPKQELSLLNYSHNLFSIFLLLALVMIAARKYGGSAVSVNPGPQKLVLYAAFTVTVFLFLARSSLSLPGWKLYYEPIGSLPKLLWAGFYDYAYITVLTLLFLFLIFLLKKFPRTQMALACFFIFLGLISTITGILNIRVVEMLGKPFNYQWFYYSGFLKSSDAKAALSSNISSDYIIDITLVILAGVFACFFFVHVVEMVLQRIKWKRLILASILLLNITYIIAAQVSLKTSNFDHDKVANPVVAFISSLEPFSPTPRLYTMDVPEEMKSQFRKRQNTKPYLPPGQIKNLVLLVLESTPAEYLKPYSREYSITPNLEKSLSNAIVFRNMYAHAPATNKSMVCLLASLYPWLSHNSITKEYPAIRVKTLSSELKARGYRTSFFNSGDSRFQKANIFLSHRGFDAAKDCKTLSCSTTYAEDKEGWEDLDGTDDACSAEALLNWIGTKDQKPFFTMMWTYQTHYPYYCSGPETKYTSADTILNRYLNAVNNSDAVLGTILQCLKDRGLDRSTLVVVIGDHGEAFGRHNQTTHASKLYEENVHIPCVFINPSFEEQSIDAIGGMADVAPTIMSALGYSSPSQWQGEDLFADRTKDRTYFFCPWSDYLFGYRKGNMKYIYNATKNITEVYDLSRDPYETNDLAEGLDVTSNHLELAAWVQYQDKFMKDLLAKSKK